MTAVDWDEFISQDAVPDKDTRPVLSAVWDAERANDPGVAGDCSSRRRHRSEHHPHPVSGRPICHICHPPMPKVKR